jgi:hypothetical protein
MSSILAISRLIFCFPRPVQAIHAISFADRIAGLSDGWITRRAMEIIVGEIS